MSVSLLEHVNTLTTACIKRVSVLTIVDGCIKHVNALTTVDGCVFVSGEHVSALTTLDGCVFLSVGTCHCFDHCALMCLCILWKISMLLSLWMGVSVSLVERISAPTIVDGSICVSGGTYQCSNHCGWVCMCLWWNISVLISLWMCVYVFPVQYVSALATVDGCVFVSGGTFQCSDHCGFVCLYL